MIEVYQAINPTFGIPFLSAPMWPDEYRLVATVDTYDLDEAYGLTNTVDYPWFETDNPKVKPLIGPCRSTSVGDVLKDTSTGNLYAVATVGFEDISEIA